MGNDFSMDISYLASAGEAAIQLKQACQFSERQIKVCFFDDMGEKKVK